MRCVVGELGWWNRPVQVVGKRATLNVAHVVRAGEYLLSEVPSSPKRRKAIEAALKARESAMAAKERAEARRAFVDAAREAGVLLGE